MNGERVREPIDYAAEFGLRQPDLWLAHGAKGRDLRVNSDIPGWLATVPALVGNVGRAAVARAVEVARSR